MQIMSARLMTTESSSLAVEAARLRKGKSAQALADKTSQLCPFCGRASHPRADSPARRASCNFCRKTNHFEAVGLKKKSRHRNHRNLRKLQPTPSSYTLWLRSVKTRSSSTCSSMATHFRSKWTPARKFQSCPAHFLVSLPSSRSQRAS